MRIITVLLLSVASLSAYTQQWAGTNPIYYNSGSVGVGTSTPSAWFPSTALEISANRPLLKLTSLSSTDLSTILFTNSNVNATSHTGEFHMNFQFNSIDNTKSLLRFGSYPANDLLTLRSDGNVGIGMSSPLNGLHVFKLNDFNTGSIRFGHSGSNDGVISMGWNSSTSNDAIKFSSFPHNSSTGQVDSMTITVAGNVGVGTTNPDAKLAVKGQVHANEVKVDLNGAIAPDYVFEPPIHFHLLTPFNPTSTKTNTYPKYPLPKRWKRMV